MSYVRAKETKVNAGWMHHLGRPWVVSLQLLFAKQRTSVMLQSVIMGMTDAFVSCMLQRHAAMCLRHPDAAPHASNQSCLAVGFCIGMVRSAWAHKCVLTL